MFLSNFDPKFLVCGQSKPNKNQGFFLGSPKSEGLFPPPPGRGASLQGSRRGSVSRIFHSISRAEMIHKVIGSWHTGICKHSISRAEMIHKARTHRFLDSRPPAPHTARFPPLLCLAILKPQSGRWSLPNDTTTLVFGHALLLRSPKGDLLQ